MTPSSKAVSRATSPGAVEAAGWVEACRLHDIPRAGARVWRTVLGDIALFRTSDDRVYALRDRCPHRGGPLSQGIVYGDKVACPLHNWSIALASGEACAPDEGATACFAVRVEDDRVFVHLAKG